MAEGKSKKKVILGGIFLGAIPLLFILYLILGPLLSILSKDISAKEMYVVTNNINVRSKPEMKSFKMGQMKFGTKVLVYEINDKWAKVLVDGQQGYVWNEYLGNPKTYSLIDGLWGDDLSKIRISKLKYRLALIRYLQEKGYTTKIKEDNMQYFDDSESEKEVFQIFSEKSRSIYNSSCYGDFDGDFVWDAAFVLKNPDTDRKLLVIFSFDKKDPLNQSKTLFETDLQETWYFIRRAAKGSKKYLNIDPENPKKIRIKIDGISIGSNRNRNLNDPEFLLLYDGQNFKMYPQEIPDK